MSNQGPETIDSLIHAKWVIPMQPKGQVLENYSIAIHHGTILQILPTEQAKKHYKAEHQTKLSHHAVLPGFVNSHCHSPMTLLRGFADDLPLMEWLQGHIWPAEQKFVGESFMADGTQLAMAEMIRTGTTCFNDMYFYPDVTAEEVSKAGMRAFVGITIINFPSNWAKNADEYIEKGLAVHDEYKNHPLINTTLAPHATYTVAPDILARVATIAEELGTPVQIHLHETAFEVQESLKQTGKRPLQIIHQAGLLGPGLQAVHMTQLNEADKELIKQHNAHIIHCPKSNLKLASGFAEVADLVNRGINIAIGTDGASSNNTLDMLSEINLAAILAKAVSQDASAIPAEQALYMATMGGAKALGIDHLVGSLKAGKAADITAIDLSQLECQPLFDPISQIVYASDRKQISHVWVNGKLLLKDRLLTTLDEQEIVAKAQEWKQKLISSK